MSNHENISQMLVDVSDDLLQSVDNKQEMQSRLDILVTAWNLSLHSRADRPLKLKRFIRKQKGLAPSNEALKELESAIKKVIKHKLNLYPDIDTELVRAETIEQGNDTYEIKVHFKDKEEEAMQKQAQYTITRMNKEMLNKPV
jgi:hypothetical protein